jgi:uncharacterized protein YegP (UPF0339 family)
MDSATAFEDATSAQRNRTLPIKKSNNQSVSWGIIMASRTYPSFLVYLDADQHFRWRLQAANHRNIANSGEGYFNYQDCLDAIGLIRSPHPIWQTQDVTNALR